MMSLTFGLFTQVSDSGPIGPLVLHYSGLVVNFASTKEWSFLYAHIL